jgi:hypothetical protein
MIFLLLQTFFGISLSALFSFSDATVALELVSSGSVGVAGTTSPCGRLLARSAHIYHGSTQQTFQSWKTGALQTQLNNLSFSTGAQHYLSMGVD